ncbi:hypothetical protein DL546_004035 [Coniochaeta pulveracea]|uniref:CCHC-type domain-containing protein n=1 Tax=Coniochaeta pulveracea TaxID=177199 RepID=A0A420XZL5_9PEZI|nr:hypothetical protein DL546_004035 [Coniochaeta pulveracea]
MADLVSDSPQTAGWSQKSDNKRPRSDDTSQETSENPDVPESKRPRRSQRQRGAKEKRLPADIEQSEAADTRDHPSLPEDSRTAPQPPHAGWNQGVKGGLRTSFGKPNNIAAELKSPIILFGSRNDRDAEGLAIGGQPEDSPAEPEAKQSATEVAEAESRAKKRATKRVRKLAKGRGKDKVSAVEPDTTVASKSQAKLAAPVQSQPNLTVKYKGQTWHLPPLAQAEEDASVKGREVWDGKFVEWFETLLDVNPSNKVPKSKPKNAGALTNLVKEAYVSWHDKSEWANKNHRDEAIQAMYRHRKTPKDLADIIGRHRKQRSGTGNNTKKASDGDISRGQAILEAEAAVKERLAADASAKSSAAPSVAGTTADSNDLEDGEIDSMVSSSPSDDEVEDDERGLSESEGQEGDLSRYFPGIGVNEVFCISCAEYGHRSNNCPEAICRFCKDRNHLSLACPTRQRCTKCRQLGHNSRSCQEKLKLTGQESLECAFCQSRTHLEEDCNEFYRSYWPGEDEIHKVKNIPIFCYACGLEGHFGTECGVGGKTVGTVVETWSKANWARYVDSDSNVEPVAGAVAPRKAFVDRPDLGHGIAPRRHEYYEESDDEEEDYFIREQVRQPRRNGQINIAPPNSRGGQASTRNGNSQGRDREFYPPLPPGPPPSYAAAAASNLPARPPQPSNNNNSNRQDGQRKQRDRSGQSQRWQDTNGQHQSGRNSGNSQGSSRGGRGGRGGGRGFSSLRGRGGYRGRN